MILYSIPLLALALLISVYYVTTVSPQAKEDFMVPIAIQLSQLSPYGTCCQLQNVLPLSVGIRGGVWNSHQYDSEGLNGHYPLYYEAAPKGNKNYSYIHVRSTVDRTYTLLDFFNLWGYPLGPNNTLGYTVPPLASQSSLYGPEWIWDMCVQFNGGPLNGGSWGNQTLVPGEGIILRYAGDGCLRFS